MIFCLLWLFFLTVKTVKGEGCAEMKHGDYSCARRNLTSMPPLHPDIETLDFSFNYLKTLNRMVFPLLYHLKHLDLTRCHIKNIAGDAFDNVKNLTTLILTGNPIEGIGHEAFNSLYRLQKLVLVDTGLFSIDELYINNLTKLQELNVGTNHLSSMSIPPTATNFMDFRILDFHVNNISVITAEQTAVLRRMKNNITIILSRNPILHIEPRAFCNMNLQELTLLDAFAASIDGLRGLTGLSVNKLVIGQSLFPRSVGVVVYDYGFLDGLCLIDFREILYVQTERLVNLGRIPVFHCMSNATKITLLRVDDMGVMQRVQLHRIKELTLIWCKLESIPDLQLSHQHTLERLTITNNARPVVFRNGFEDMPLLWYVDLSNNQIILDSCCKVPFRGTPHLQHLNMSNNPKIIIHIDAFETLENLEVLDFHRTKVDALGEYATMRQLTRLQYLDISYTYTTFNNPLALLGLNSLRVLKMSGNHFQGDTLQHLFVNLTLLETLDISHCGIENLHWSFSTNMYKLRHLTLSGNKLMDLDFLTNPSLAALSLLDIGKNQISSIDINILHSLPKNLTAFDLSYNPFDCSCSQTVFILWLIEHKNILVHQQCFLCLSPSASKETIVFDFDIQYCTHIWWTKLFLSIFVLVLVLALSALAYRFQFYLRYGCVLLRGYKVPRPQEFRYDAFVIYSNKDEVWVVEQLVEKLENGVPPIQLCLEERNFDAGKSIASALIDEGILGSRKVIVVVSRHFIDSAWCRFEFEVAQSFLLMDGNPNIIIIILEDVEEERTKKVLGLHKYLKNNTYLEWKDNPISNVRFWARLREAVISETQE